MINFMLFLLVLSLIGCTSSQVGSTDVDWFKNCTVSVNVSEGSLAGPFTFRDPSGTARAIGRFKEGKKDGTWAFFDAKGVKGIKFNFEDGVLSGPCTMWYGSFQDSEVAGRKKVDCFFKAGNFHGEYRNYYPSGKKRSECIFNDGVIVSARAWEEQGNEVSKEAALANAQGDLVSDKEYLADRENVVAMSLTHARRISVEPAAAPDATRR